MLLSRRGFAFGALLPYTFRNSGSTLTRQSQCAATLVVFGENS